MNYILNGLNDLRTGFLIGIALYGLIFLLLHILKLRKGLSWKCLAEICFCVYGVTLLSVTGIFKQSYSFGGIISYNLIPFVDSSIVPVLLNFLLFIPYGFLLPLTFSKWKWNWKKVVIIGGLTSLAIELLQAFGGRYAEIDDLLINTLGAVSGFVLYLSIGQGKKNPKKALAGLGIFCVGLSLCFAGLFFLGNNGKELPDGLNAVEDQIAEVNVYYNGEKRTLTPDAHIYRSFVIQLSNCGGHVLEADPIPEDCIWNDDCFIEVRYAAPQNIVFENAKDFSIENADRLLYNANQNRLYWGTSGYQNAVDYTKLGEELQAHREAILEQYQQLPALIMEYFAEHP